MGDAHRVGLGSGVSVGVRDGRVYRSLRVGPADVAVVVFAVLFKIFAPTDPMEEALGEIEAHFGPTLDEVEVARRVGARMPEDRPGMPPKGRTRSGGGFQGGPPGGPTRPGSPSSR